MELLSLVTRLRPETADITDHLEAGPECELCHLERDRVGGHRLEAWASPLGPGWRTSSCPHRARASPKHRGASLRCLGLRRGPPTRPRSCTHAHRAHATGRQLLPTVGYSRRPRLSAPAFPRLVTAPTARPRPSPSLCGRAGPVGHATSTLDKPEAQKLDDTAGLVGSELFLPHHHLEASPPPLTYRITNKMDGNAGPASAV